MASTYRANFEGVFRFSVRAKHTAGALLGPTENLLIDPATGLRKRRDFLPDAVVRWTDRYLRVPFTDAARDVPDTDELEEEVADAT